MDEQEDGGSSLCWLLLPPQGYLKLQPPLLRSSTLLGGEGAYPIPAKKPPSSERPQEHNQDGQV